MEEQAEAQEDLTGIPTEFYDCVRKHGRALWTLVFNSNLGQEALAEIERQSQKHQSRRLGVAGVCLGNVLRDMSVEYAQAKGWGQAEIDACAQDILFAVQTRPVVPGDKSIILLN